MTRNLLHSLLAVVLTGGVTLSACDNPATSPEEPASKVLRSATQTAATVTLIEGPILPQSPPHPFVGKQVWITPPAGGYGLRCISPTIMSMASPEVTAGTRVVARFCDPINRAWQSFTVQQTLALRDQSQVSLRSAKWPDLCLAVRGGTAQGGELLELATCSPAISQRFRLPQPTSAMLAQGPIRTMVSGERMGLEIDKFSVQAVCDILQQALQANRVPQQWDIRVVQ